MSENGLRAREAARGARSRAFGEALRRARGGQEAPAADAPRASGARGSAARRAGDAAGDAERSRRREGSREGERAASTGAPAPPPPKAPGDEVPDASALRAAVRALPAAIDAPRPRDGGPLTLSFGRALEVDLRAVPGGVEVVLRPDARLARAAEAELPALVASLRRRGVAVARAEVRARGAARGPRVDVSPALR